MTNLTIDLQVPIERVRVLLVGAFEGGSNYWYANLDAPKATRALKTDDWLWPFLGPTTKGHHVTLEEQGDEGDPDNGTEHRLDLGVIRRGLLVMAAKYPRHFGDFMAENDDADTGDVFLQCCLFGEVKYG